MKIERKIIIFIILFFIVSLIKEVPYVNVLVIDKIWVIYGFLVFCLFIPYIVDSISYTIPILLLLALIVTLFHLNNVGEIIGILLYILIWIVWFLKVRKLLIERENSQ